MVTFAWTSGSLFPSCRQCSMPLVVPATSNPLIPTTPTRVRQTLTSSCMVSAIPPSMPAWALHRPIYLQELLSIYEGRKPIQSESRFLMPGEQLVPPLHLPLPSSSSSLARAAFQPGPGSDSLHPSGLQLHDRDHLMPTMKQELVDSSSALWARDTTTPSANCIYSHVDDCITRHHHKSWHKGTQTLLELEVICLMIAYCPLWCYSA